MATTSTATTSTSPPGASLPGGDAPAVATFALTRDYGGTGLFGVDLRVPRGCVYGLVGPNGAGKTTMLSIITGIRHADGGTVEVAVPRRHVAVCPDVPEFDGWLTAHEAVDLARSFVAPEHDAATVLGALQTAGLADSAGRRVGGFSRGMTQRLGLACALVGDPRLLICAVAQEGSRRLLTRRSASGTRPTGPANRCGGLPVRGRAAVPGSGDSLAELEHGQRCPKSC
jgi:ABC-type branched-subunit amino acid transport system ATPase component